MMQRTLGPESVPENDGGQVREIAKHWTIQESASRRPARGNLFGPARQFDPNEPELMDRPDVNKAWLREELEALEKLNRLGGHQLILRYIRRLLGSRKVESVNCLDLATGAADIPRASVTWGQTRGTR